jgi:hypothetical protein
MFLLLYIEFHIHIPVLLRNTILVQFLATKLILFFAKKELIDIFLGLLFIAKHYRLQITVWITDNG